MDDPLIDDLEDEYQELDALVASLDEAQWDAPTPAAPWTVRDQVFHLAFGDELAALAATDPEAFAPRLDELVADLDRLDADSRERARALSPPELLGWWREQRDQVVAALRRLPPDARLGWITGEMSRASFATARLMETWAHGQDVADALGRTRRPTDRLRHVAHLGVRTRAFAYRNRGMEPPPVDVRVELESPSGEVWTWGDEAAPERVTGSALDFCLVVTQRRHRADTGLVTSGEAAEEWLGIAQAYAGPPTDGRPAAAVAP